MRWKEGTLQSYPHSPRFLQFLPFLQLPKDLVRNLLEVDPKKRYTAEQVLQHPWIEMVGHTNTGNSQKEESPNS